VKSSLRWDNRALYQATAVLGGEDNFAKHIGVGPLVIRDICEGKGSVTRETALRMGNALDTTPDFWLNLQHGFDYARALHLLRTSGQLKGIKAVKTLKSASVKRRSHAQKKKHTRAS
jgi:addiction module antidote protein, HigA family